MFKFLRIALCATSVLSSPLLAQDEPAEGADDAFGRRIGLEGIGLYSTAQVRGFNLENAGNYRIEGHYFARAATPGWPIRVSALTRIGVNALRYDFPAPSGVAEYGLREAAKGTALTIEAGSRAYSGPFADIIASHGSADGKLGVVAALNLGPWQKYVNGAGGDYYGGGAVARWSPVDSVKLNAFVTLSDWVADPDTGVQTDGTFLPPRLKRGILRIQPWSRFDNREQTGGLFGSAELGNGWKLSGGAFHSASQSDRTDFHLLDVRNRDGDYRSLTIVAPRRSASAQSGSALVERSWGGKAVRHRVVATVRYRETDNVNSPSLVFDTGSGNFEGNYPIVDKPAFTISGERALSRATQATVGAGYRVTFGDRLELRGDVQKTDYRKTSRDVAGVETGSRSKPWLYSGSVLFAATDALSAFASYSRGLEESGIAPNGAVNRGEVLPAVIATQREVGIRYALNDSVSFIGGLFDTRKDTPGIGPDGRFDLVGEVRHRGVEASLTGAITPRLNVVAGMMVLDAKVSGDLVDAGLIRRDAVGRPSRIGLVNLVWRPAAVDGLTLDGSFNHEGGRYIDPRTDVRTKAFSTVDVGLRYAFKAGSLPLAVRARALNIFNKFAWNADPSGTLFPIEQRGYQLSLRADF